MKSKGKQLADWAIKKIESEFKDDVCLLIEHKTLYIDEDADAMSFGFYVPATNRANGLNRTFIIDGIGYDLFPMPWSRLENMADMKDYNTKCLGYGKILWARSEEDAQRFESLQARLQANLKNPSYMLERAVKWHETVKGIYQDTLFEPRLHKVRTNAGHICDLLSIAVAYVNGQYFTHGQTNQLDVLAKMNKLPKDFIQLYRKIFTEPCPDAQLKLCYEIIVYTKNFLAAQERHTPTNPKPDFAELAMWYQELCYTWRRVYHWCAKNDPINVYIWSSFLQDEAEEWGAKFGITDTDIMSAYDATNLAGFRMRAEVVESNFRRAIEANGVKIDEYASVEDFLSAN